MHLYCDWKKLKIRFRVCGKDSLKTAALSTRNSPPLLFHYVPSSPFAARQMDGLSHLCIPQPDFANRTAEEHVSYTRGDKKAFFQNVKSKKILSKLISFRRDGKARTHVSGVDFSPISSSLHLHNFLLSSI